MKADHDDMTQQETTMGIRDYVEGWAVSDADGINVRTISDTRRAAIVNWLFVKASKCVVEGTSDKRIEEAWEANCGDAVAVRVRIVVQ